MSDRKEFYDKLRDSLNEVTKFPAKYLFKFIVPSSGTGESVLKSMFDHLGAVITTKKSKTGKYNSISILVNMDTADDVILKYKEAEKIEGIISL